DCPNNPLGHFGFREIEVRMDTGYHVIKGSEQLIIKIEPTVGQNITLRAFENLKPLEARVERINLRLLLAHSLRSESISNVKRFRMIGDAQISEAELLGRLSHFLDTSRAIAPRGVAVECA